VHKFTKNRKKMQEKRDFAKNPKNNAIAQ